MSETTDQEYETWLKQFEELLEDYAQARAETAIFNVTQRSGMRVRMPHPRLKRLMEHIAKCPAKICDLPGQCRHEGECHHPRATLAVEKRSD